MDHQEPMHQLESNGPPGTHAPTETHWNHHTQHTQHTQHHQHQQPPKDQTKTDLKN